MSSALEGKSIVLGICGGIAAYKSIELVRMIAKQGASVQVVMTANAGHFVTPLTLEALSRQKVCSSLFDPHESASVQHIEWAENADAVIIAPATANIVAKLAHGIADDALSTFMLAVTSPAMICPSMNSNMYASEPVQRNLEVLKGFGYHVVEPEAGELACGTTGPGRLPEPEYIMDRLNHLMAPKDFDGRNVLVTAGPTREAIDPVRFISNPSTGKMGYAIARAAEMRGAAVTLVSGPTALAVPTNVRLVRVTSADEMASAVLENLEMADIVIKSAAVGDYRPVDTASQKIKKDRNELNLALERTQDILKAVAQHKTCQIVVGFAAETQKLDQFATEKLKAKKLDLMVGNLIGANDAGFGADTNRVTLYFANGARESLEVMPKAQLSDLLLDRIAGLM